MTQNFNTSLTKFLYKEINNFQNLNFECSLFYFYRRLYSENEQKIITQFITFDFVEVFSI